MVTVTQGNASTSDELNQAAVSTHHPLHVLCAGLVVNLFKINTLAHRARKLGAARHHIPQRLGRFIVCAPVQLLLFGY